MGRDAAGDVDGEGAARPFGEQHRDDGFQVIGINVDDMIVGPSAGFREALGINRFPSAANTLG